MVLSVCSYLILSLSDCFNHMTLSLMFQWTAFETLDFNNCLFLHFPVVLVYCGIFNDDDANDLHNSGLLQAELHRKMPLLANKQFYSLNGT